TSPGSSSPRTSTAATATARSRRMCRRRTSSSVATGVGFWSITTARRSSGRWRPRNRCTEGRAASLRSPRSGRFPWLLGRLAEERGHLPERGRVVEETQVAAAHDRRAAAPQAKWGRRDDDVGGAEDRGLALRQGVRQVRGAERDEAADARALAPLEQVTGDEAAQAVPDDVDLRPTGRLADRLDRAPEAPRQLLVVHPRRVREGREVVEAPRDEEAAEEAEVARVAEKAVHQHDRRRVGRLRVEVRGRDPHLVLGCEGGERGEEEGGRRVETSLPEGPRDERPAEGPRDDRQCGLQARVPKQAPCPERAFDG